MLSWEMISVESRNHSKIEYVTQEQLLQCLKDARQEDREDKRILFGKIDAITEKVGSIANGLALIEGARK